VVLKLLFYAYSSKLYNMKNNIRLKKEKLINNPIYNDWITQWNIKSISQNFDILICVTILSGVLWPWLCFRTKLTEFHTAI